MQAPWTDEQVEGIRRWQASGMVHPLTCGPCRDDACGCDDRLDVTNEALTHHCGYRQVWVPDVCVGGFV